jgi:hypothetical protein
MTIWPIAAMGSASVGFAIRSFIIKATPISMVELNHYRIEETKWVGLGIDSVCLSYYLLGSDLGSSLWRTSITAVIE